MSTKRVHPRARRLTSLADLERDVKNANRGTPRGGTLLAGSLREYGAGRSILVDRDGRIIAGNKTVEQATTIGMPIKVVETTGDELVVVRRNDLDLEHDDRARKLALADNRIAELNLDWDPAMLKQHLADGISLDDLWIDTELERLIEEGIHPGLTDDAIANIAQNWRARQGSNLRPSA